MRVKIFEYILLFTILVTILYVGGAKPDWSSLPDPRPRVLSMFTDVPEGFVKVVDTTDGDTITVLQDGKEETVRFLGVDTPETRDPRRQVQCFGKEASNFTKELLAGKAVKLVTDPLETDRDKYGRLLRWIYLEDRTTVNERLVYGGYAFAYEAFPTARTEKLKEMEADARQNNRGLWGGCQVTIKNNGKQKSTQVVEKTK